MAQALKLADWQRQEEDVRAELGRVIAQQQQQIEEMARFIFSTKDMTDWLLMRDRWDRREGRRTELQVVMQFLADQSEVRT